jgi:hypothetical protein
MNVPSHFGSSLPFDSVLVVLMRTRSSSANSMGIMTLSLQRFVDAGVGTCPPRQIDPTEN